MNEIEQAKEQVIKIAERLTRESTIQMDKKKLYEPLRSAGGGFATVDYYDLRALSQAMGYLAKLKYEAYLAEQGDEGVPLND
jgi:hypothetical protein